MGFWGGKERPVVPAVEEGLITTIGAGPNGRSPLGEAVAASLFGKDNGRNLPQLQDEEMAPPPVVLGKPDPTL